MIIFSLLFGTTFRVSFDGSIYASSQDYYDLVSIIVSEDMYDQV